jgi:hypothetical protein
LAHFVYLDSPCNDGVGATENETVKKRKRPKLVIDNKLPDEPTEEFTYEEFKVIADQLLETHERYPEIDALTRRARDNKDMAMIMTAFELTCRYDEWRDYLAEKKRNKLRVVKKRDP